MPCGNYKEMVRKGDLIMITDNQKPIFDLAELLDEAKDRIEEKLHIEGEVRKWRFIEELKRTKGLS